MSLSVNAKWGGADDDSNKIFLDFQTFWQFLILWDFLTFFGFTEILEHFGIIYKLYDII